MTVRVKGQDKSLLTIESTKEVGQIEVGSPYVGIEIHKSFPLLNRISFYYPVANSIDISEDYWKRENFRIMFIGLKVGDSEKRFLKNQIYKVSQTTYSVSFSGYDLNSEIKIKYEFCKNEPAVVITYEITNTSDSKKDYEVYTRLETTLRTSHTYKTIDSAYTEYQKNGSIIRVNYPFVETGNSQIFVINTGMEPSSFTTKKEIGNGFENLDDWWLKNNSPLPQQIITKEKFSKPVAAFIYKKKLAPKASVRIIQIVGSSLIAEAKEKTKYLSANYPKEVQEYENYILKESLDKNVIVTGDKDFDFTSRWAKAILTTNAHFLNGQIVPMPAQAEYNFYFTHDALLTDLAAVNFDLNRVKNDLKYIISLADTNKTIPHAYYWKDTEYKTEFAGTENWNHFWFTLVSARYLRHSGDLEFLNQLYPYIEHSIKTALKNKGKIDLMWSFRPDWWDIGNNFGPRAYMTILAIRALREFSYISASLKKENSKLQFYDELANRMNKNLIDSLWDDKLNYLISYFEDGSKDTHIYMGSLLASHFNLLDSDKNLKFITTAKENLLDEKLGIYTLFPMDLHLLIDYMKFAGNEAGDPYHYANGGIWPHGNSWYALSLISNGLKEDAFQFIKKTMRLNGIINSPNGQPALYEYRISDKNNPAIYGKIDKPQFLWAGGWYFYTLYNLFGLRENEWNISFDPFLPMGFDSVNFNLTCKGKLVNVIISGNGDNVTSIKYDDRQIPSLIIPEDLIDLKKITVQLGDTVEPILSSANGFIYNPVYDSNEKILNFNINSLEGDDSIIKILSPSRVDFILIDGVKIENGYSEKKINNQYELTIHHITEANENHFTIQFESR
jgi:cellobiose phosphorylase